jgi:hypothetical protein
MNLDAFWETIADARRATSKLVDVPSYLVDVLSRKEESQIVDYGFHFRNCMDQAYDANLWLGAVVILGGCGDDRFTDFRCWLIAQGREAFESALADPDSLADLENFEGDYGYPILFCLGSVARQAFCKRVAGDPDDFDAIQKFEALLPRRTHPGLKNEELVNTSYDDAKAVLPRLAAKFPEGMRVEGPK